MSGLYRFATGLIEPLVLGTAALIEPPDDTLRRDRRGELTPAPGGTWFHAASAGEMRGLVPLVRTLAGMQPLVVTAQTAAGLAAGRLLLSDLSTDREPLHDCPVQRMPFDLPGVMRRAFDRSAVAAVIVAETELWPNMLAEAVRRSIPVALVNARISNRSWPRYRASRFFWRKRLPRLRAVAAQTAWDAERFRELGVSTDAIAVTGNMKHDLRSDPATPAEHPWGDAPIVVLGSVRPGEETILAGVMGLLRATVPNLKIVVAPRHREADEPIERAFRAEGFSPSRRSRGGPGAVDNALILDTMGELNRFYALARVAFVGGTLRNYGGHNVAEPALVGTPVVFGPSIDNCRLEAEALVQSGAGCRAGTAEELLAAFSRKMTLDRGEAGRRCREAVMTLAGATERTIRFLARRDFPGAWPGISGEHFPTRTGAS